MTVEGRGRSQGRAVLEDPLTEAVIGAAIAVHRVVGPVMLESVYEACLRHELDKRGLGFETQVTLPVTYDGVRLNAHYRIDLVVAGELVVELKCVEKVLPVHRAQLITYLRLGGFRRGLLINFNEARLVDGVTRVVG
ncbi:MAG TPA: GxxExxY protein [Gemmatimonadaceae bacterium]|nr:GxxExxY protein [Gemmatimonadaceae bacterium]